MFYKLCGTTFLMFFVLYCCKPDCDPPAMEGVLFPGSLEDNVKFSGTLKR